MNKMYILDADREAMKEFVYEVLVPHTASIHLGYKIGGSENERLLVHLVNEDLEKWFVKACNAYNVTIMYSEKEAA